jgi:cell division protein FtsZ
VLINITGSSSLKLNEVTEACSIVQEAADEDANIIFGAVLDETLDDEVKMTVIATGFRYQQGQHVHPGSSASVAISHARIASAYKEESHVSRSGDPAAKRVTGT